MKKVVIRTRNSLYEIKIIEGRRGEILFRGGQFFTELCFSVRAVEFCRGTGNPGELGWPIGLIQKGMPVRIAYSEIDQFPKILRLDIGPTR